MAGERVDLRCREHVTGMAVTERQLQDLEWPFEDVFRPFGLVCRGHFRDELALSSICIRVVGGETRGFENFEAQCASRDAWRIGRKDKTSSCATA